MEIDFIKKDLKRLLSEERYQHSLRVAEVAKELAIVYHYDEDKAYLTGLVHDIAKEFTKEQNEAIMSGYDQKVLAIPIENPRLIHSDVGAIYLKERYGFDEEICHAVKSHTIGDIPMGLLDKIVFVADKIEPGKRYCGIEMERELAYQNIHQALILCMENNHRQLRKVKKFVEPKSIRVLDYLKSTSKDFSF